MMDEKKANSKIVVATEQVAAPVADLRTPEQWAEQLGHVKKASPFTPQLRSHMSWQHAAADSLHGWSLHAHHYQASPLLISQEDYQAALYAACEYPNVHAHRAALGKRTRETR